MSELTLEFSNTRGGSGTQQDPFIATHGIITVLRGTGLNHRSTIPRTSGYDKSAFSPDERWGSTDRHGVGSHTYTIDWPKLIGPTPVTFTQWVAHPVNGWKKVERTAWFAPETEGDPLADIRRRVIERVPKADRDTLVVVDDILSVAVQDQ